MDERARKRFEGILSGVDQVIDAAGGMLRIYDLGILEYLRENGRAGAGELSQALSLSPSRVTRCTTRLVGLGLIEGVLDRNDRRKVLFSLTNRGGNVVFEVARAYGPERAKRLLVRLSAVNRVAHEVKVEDGIGLGSSALRILVALGIAGDAQPVGEVQRLARMSQSRTSMALSALKDKGFVCVQRATKDARMRLYALTDSGARIAQLLVAAMLDDGKNA